MHNMQIKSYKVTCEQCGGSDTLKITDDNTVFYTNHVPIISARFRPDLQWGFECSCGQDSRVAIEEKDQLDMLVRGAPQTVRQIARNLKRGNESKFRMEPA
jgi:hypothetical protein